MEYKRELFAAARLGPSNALPFSGLGAAKLAPRFYADASAATRSAATACWTARNCWLRQPLSKLTSDSLSCSRNATADIDVYHPCDIGRNFDSPLV